MTDRVGGLATTSTDIGTADRDGHDAARLARIIGWIATAIALVVGLAIPAGYFLMAARAEARESAMVARLHAAFLLQAIGTGADVSDSGKSDWRQEVVGLIGANLAPGDLPEQRVLFDAEQRVLDVSGPPVRWPVLVRSAALVSNDGRLGAVQVYRSLWPLLGNAAILAVLAALLGIAIHASPRVLPLKALLRALAELRRQEGQAQEQAEQQLRVVFEHAVEGILVFGADGRIISGNPAAAQMLGYSLLQLGLLPLNLVLINPTERDWSESLDILQCETFARRRDGTEFPVDLTVTKATAAGQQQRIAVLRDISERRQHEARLSQLANYDSLTGLPNRALFRDRLQHAVARSRRNHSHFALMFLDLDRFKTINDSLGHDVGDKLLIEVATLLSHCVRESDTLSRLDPTASAGVFRLGGDEFTVLAEDINGSTDAAMIAERILRALAVPLLIGPNELFVTASIGITLYPDDDSDPDGLVKQADMAMYRSKELGRNTYYFFDEALNAEAHERHALEVSLRHALARSEFRLHYQPKADLNTNEIIGIEALLRWQRPGVGLVGPDRFIPLLEETGLIVPVGIWVLRESCAQMMRWQRAGLAAMSLAVNLSARQFRQQDLTAQIAQVLAETGFDPSLLEVELTESMLIEDTEAVLRILASLGAMGVQIAIDDFGTGHSSLSYLKRFNVDTLKIDRSFVRDTPDDASDCAIATTVIALARGLRLKVVAEGVENKRQAAFLRRQGCDAMQGYLLSPPLSADALSDWLLSRRTAPPSEPAVLQSV